MMATTANIIRNFGALGEPLSDHLEPPADFVDRDDEDDMDFGSPDDDTEDLETDHIWAKEHA